MKKNQLHLYILLFIVSALLILQPGLARSSEQYTIRTIMAWSKNATEYKAFSTFLEILEQHVAKKAPGELKMQLIGGPEVTKATDQVQALQRGMVDAVYTSGAYYTNVLGEADALKLSNFTPSEERARGATAYLNEIHQKKLGVYFLGRLGLDIKFHLYLAKKPIDKADLKGLNIRVSPLYLQAVKGWGGNPVVMPLSDVYIALERNVVDGYCMPSVGIRDYGVHKQTKYMVDPGFYTVPNPLMINMKVWGKLPKKLQDVLTEAAIEAEKKITAIYQEMEKQERPILIKEGIQIITLPPAEAEKYLRIAYDEGWKDVIQKNPQTGPELKKYLSKTK
ncbi:MAG: TRAP transporter substrate-binding protein DctP [Syntrophorhabdaceae bacterium]|nr:TRAP transporter substrate-binding protein DctP [Syntrophorhabdaceae bacterium]